jgi:hypothetical protein
MFGGFSLLTGRRTGNMSSLKGSIALEILRRAVFRRTFWLNFLLRRAGNLLERSGKASSLIRQIKRYRLDGCLVAAMMLKSDAQSGVDLWATAGRGPWGKRGAVGNVPHVPGRHLVIDGLARNTQVARHRHNSPGKLDGRRNLRALTIAPGILERAKGPAVVYFVTAVYKSGFEPEFPRYFA